MTRAAPTPYSEELAIEICVRLAEGESLRSICRSGDMPSVGSVFRWMEANERFRERYARARRVQAEVFADEMNDIADDGSNDWMGKADEEGGVGYKLNGEHIQRSKLRIDTRKWIASKILPKVYGDKMALTDGDGGPLQVVVQQFSQPSKKDVDG